MPAWTPIVAYHWPPDYRYDLRMIRQVLCLILMPALLANQAALCCAHSHEGHTNSAPHIHFSTTSHGSHFHSHSHDHHHHGDVHEHHHHRPVKKTDESQNASPQIDASSHLDGHDGAVFVCKHSSFLTKTNRAVFAGTPCMFDASFDFGPTPMVNTDEHQHNAKQAFGAPARLHGGACAIFLQTRSLRL